MGSYLEEIEEQLSELQGFELTKDRLVDEFNTAIPDAILDERRRRARLANQQKQAQLAAKLKRPPQLNLLKKKDELDKTNKSFKEEAKTSE